MKEIKRIKEKAVLTGLCAGIAEYFGVKPSLVRAVVVLLQLSLWAMLIIYFLVSFNVPEKQEQQEKPADDENNGCEVQEAEKQELNKV